MVSCRFLSRSEKNSVLPVEGQLQELLGYFVSFTLYKEISSKEAAGAWFVLNKTEDMMPLTFALLIFLF